MSSVIAKTALTGLQSAATTVVTSTINSFEIDGKGKLGFNSNAFTSSVKGGLTSTVGGMVNTFTAGTLNLGLEGFVGDVFNNGSKLSGFVGGLASQGVQYAMGGDFTMNILNTSMFGAKNGTGLFELRFGRDGFRAGIGMGGMDASFGTIASAIKGLEAWKVNAEIWGSDEAEASRYTSSLRTLYSSDEVTRAEYEAILAGKTNVVERGSVDYTESVMMNDGTKNIYLGSDALNDGNRFGLNVVFAHEAYRDGVVTDDNYLETREAVEGHIATAEKLIQIYGPDVLGEGYALEVALFNNAKETGDWSVFEEYTSGAYDSSGDFWRLTNDGKLLFDGRATVTDHETGEEILSLDELGMNDDSDYTTSLARILGISNAEASQVVRSMFDPSSELNRKYTGGYIGLQIQGIKDGASGRYEQDYKNALINTAKSFTSGSVGLEQAFVAFNGQDVNIFLNHEMILGTDFRTDVFALSRIGQLYTDNEWDQIWTNENLSPLAQAMFAGMYDQNTTLGFDRFSEYVQETTRRGYPQYTASVFDRYAGGGGMSAMVQLLATALAMQGNNTQTKDPRNQAEFDLDDLRDMSPLRTPEQASFSSQMSPSEAARYAAYWSKYAPKNIAGGPQRMDWIRVSSRTGRVEMSRVIYDEFGRQTYRVDMTNHLRPLDHSNPHLHQYLYGSNYNLYREYLFNFWEK